MKKRLLIFIFTLTSISLFSSSERDNPFRKVARDVTPVVVQINTVFKRKVPTGNSLFEYFFRDENKDDKEEKFREYESQGLGSGVVVRADGDKKYVLTNNHVIDGAESFTVVFNNGDSYEATLVGADKRKDLALLEFKTKDSIPVAKLGDSDDIYIGDWAIAIGSPLGYQSTVTLGIISAVGRPSVPGMGADFTDYIQTDAAINRGNSGGALVNIDGEIIGINTWIASQTGGNIGLGFAVPINNAKSTINQLINTGSVEYGWLGVSIGPVSEVVQEEFEIKQDKGAFIHNVFIGSPADKGGIVPGDIVTSIDDKDIDSDSDLSKIVGSYPVGRETEFTIIRDNKTVKLRVKLDKRNEESLNAKVWTGISPMTLTKDIVEKYNDSAENKLKRNTKGVIVAGILKDSVARITGVLQGDIITHIDGKGISNLKEYYLELGKAQEEVILTVIRNGQKIKLILLKE